MATEKTVLRALAAAQDAVQSARSRISSYATLEEWHSDRDDLLKGAAQEIEFEIRRAYVATRLLFELMGLREELARFVRDFEAVPSALSEVNYHDEFDGFYNVHVDLIASCLSAIAPLFEAPAEVDILLAVARRMLRQVPAYILGGPNPQPKREKDVQDAIEAPLRMAFPDLIREKPIPKQTKSYHPDFAIESLTTAIEVKFVDELKDAGTVVGGIYEDSLGYANAGFERFLALIYQTDSFLTQEQVDAEARKSGLPPAWTMIVVTGPGVKK